MAESSELKPAHHLLKKFQAASSSSNVRAPVIAGTAGGIYFFWQLGVIEGLKKHCNLGDSSFVAASSSGLVSALAACNVDCEAAISHALTIAKRSDLFSRRLGLLGIWGSMIKEWLRELLPDNAHDICSGRVHLLLNEVNFKGIRQVYVDKYHDKEDLIDALLASAHFPGLVDWKPIASFRGRWCHDGSFLGSASRVALSLQQVHPHTLIINYEHDANLRQPTFLELGNLLSMEGVRQLFAAGEKHATFLMSSAIPGD